MQLLFKKVSLVKVVKDEEALMQGLVEFGMSSGGQSYHRALILRMLFFW